MKTLPFEYGSGESHVLWRRLFPISATPPPPPLGIFYLCPLSRGGVLHSKCKEEGSRGGRLLRRLDRLTEGCGPMSSNQCCLCCFQKQDYRVYNHMHQLYISTMINKTVGLCPSTYLYNCAQRSGLLSNLSLFFLNVNGTAA